MNTYRFLVQEIEFCQSIPINIVSCPDKSRLQVYANGSISFSVSLAVTDAIAG